MLQEVADYDFTELITDLVYILFTLQAPTELSAIVAHDYGASCWPSASCDVPPCEW